MSVHSPKLTAYEREQLAQIGKKTIKPEDRVEKVRPEKELPVRNRLRD